MEMRTNPAEIHQTMYYRKIGQKQKGACSIQVLVYLRGKDRYVISHSYAKTWWLLHCLGNMQDWGVSSQYKSNEFISVPPTRTWGPTNIGHMECIGIPLDSYQRNRRFTTGQPATTVWEMLGLARWTLVTNLHNTYQLMYIHDTQDTICINMLNMLLRTWLMYMIHISCPVNFAPLCN